MVYYNHQYPLSKLHPRTANKVDHRSSSIRAFFCLRQERRESATVQDKSGESITTGQLDVRGGYTMVLFVLLLLTIGFVWAAERWGVDSRDGIDSSEWQRRADYPAYHL